LSVRYLY